VSNLNARLIGVIILPLLGIATFGQDRPQQQDGQTREKTNTRGAKIYSGEEFVRRLSEGALTVNRQDEPLILKGIVKRSEKAGEGNTGTILFASEIPDSPYVEIPGLMIATVETKEIGGDRAFAVLQLKQPTSPEAKVYASLLRQAALRGGDCSQCGCTGFYDNNDNGLCNGTDWDDPTPPLQYCGHTILTHTGRSDLKHTGRSDERRVSANERE
jgi:hypothetical protein